MKTLRLKNIIKTGNVLKYEFCAGEEIKKYFSDKEYVIEYPVDIENVPDSVAAVPFAASVLPIVWLSDAELIIEELDEDFFNCLPELKKGYETMFEGGIFKGKISVKHTMKNAGKGDRRALFFSGGVDSAQTLISHYEEKPDLLSVWGSDIKFDNEDGWAVVQKGLAEGAKCFGFKNEVIRSAFREFDKEGLLGKDFYSRLHDGWWHGVKHGLALLGHVAPLAYLRGYKKFYIASTNCAEDGKVRCASNPLTDNCVRFAGCRVFHDGFEFSRQDKIRNIIDFVKKNHPLSLHVCWESQSGSNCCYCEKCYRTIFGFLAENEDPTPYGFLYFEQAMERFNADWLKREYLQKNLNLRQAWTLIAKRVKENDRILKKNPYYKKLKSIADLDFRKIDSFNLSLKLRIKQKIKRFIKDFKTKLTIKKDFLKFGNSLKGKVLLIGSPTHANIGDSAIVLAEKKLLNDCGYKFSETTMEEYAKYSDLIIKKCNKNKIICLHGGGNMGNQWLGEEKFRRNVIETFKNNKIVVFPQTMFYSQDDSGQKEKEDSVPVYNKSNVTLVAREQESYIIMKKLYPLANVILTPDIVLYTDEDFFGLEPLNRDGILFIMRSDPERAMNEDDRTQLKDYVKELGFEYSVSDMYSQVRITKENRQTAVRDKFNEFKKARLVITDRLHGMVFSAITKTPCVVFSNYNHKVKGTYEWIKYLPYVKFAAGVAEAKRYIDELLNIKDCAFENKLLPLFDKIKDVLKDNA